MLTRDTWHRLEELFHQASGLPVAEREAFARQQAGDAPELLAELLAMLRASTEATRRLETPLRGIAELLEPGSETATLPAGTRLGPWAIVRLLGAGGMGQVYLAERADGAYRHEVAIKLIATRASSERMRGGFEYECRLLAQMQHPAIAHIHDAGTDADGRPYLVMEYIRGEPITHWCDRNRLDLRGRIELLAKVCEGVQHAHQKGVIHRDLKPGNLLVTEVDGRPQPKIIDFGIAAELDGLHTGPAGGTPGYMSPEQSIPDGNIDARSDVHALGALLHELACGARPAADAPAAPSHHLASMALQERQRVADARASTPARLARDCRDGLDAIATMALQPDPAARYDAVSALLEDLRRWLGHYPVRAGGNGRFAMLRKFVRRNRLAVSSASALLLVLLGGLAATGWSLHQARQEAQRAKVTADYLSSILDSVDPAIAQGADKTLMLHVLNRASARASRDLAAFPDVQADMELLLAINLISLSEYDKAIAHLQSVRTLAARYPGQLEFQRLRALQIMGDALGSAGREVQATQVLREGIAAAERGPAAWRWLAEDMRSRLSLSLFYQGKAQEGLRMGRDAFSALSALMPADDQQRLDAEKRYADMLVESGQRDAAEPLYRDLIERRMRLNGADHPLTLFARRQIAILHLQERRFDVAETELRPLLASVVHLYGADSEMAADIGSLLGSALREQGKVKAAGPYYRQAMEYNLKRYGADAFNAIVTRHNHANWLLADGQPLAAEHEQTALLGIAEARLGDVHQVTAEILRGLAEAELALGKRPAARRHAERSLQIIEKLYGEAGKEAQRDIRDTLARIDSVPAEKPAAKAR